MLYSDRDPNFKNKVGNGSESNSNRIFLADFIDHSYNTEKIYQFISKEKVKEEYFIVKIR